MKDGASVGVTLPTSEQLTDGHRRFSAMPALSGHDGGHETNLRQYAADGMTLAGHLTGARGGELTFADDLTRSLQLADDFFDERFRTPIDTYIERAAIDAPRADDLRVDYQPHGRTELDLRREGISTIIWATGYGLDYGWIDAPLLDEFGYPQNERGVASIPGLYFLGLLWQHTQASASLVGPILDGPHIVEMMDEHRRGVRSVPPPKHVTTGRAPDEEHSMTEPVTHALEVPGAVLRYDVRDSDPPGGPVLVLIGSPMGAAGFGTLATHFTDYTIVTYDPRGVERSERTDLDLEVTPEVHAADIRAVIEAVDGGPVDLFASSGGAVNALALVATHPGLVRTVVAHEAPAASLLPDATSALAASRAVHETYERHGWGHGMAHFIALVSLRGPVPDDFASQPAPDPAMFGMPTEDDGARDDLMLGSNIITITHYRPDIDALRASPTRIVLAVGADSDGELAHRGAEAVAELLGTSPVTFPGGHGGFAGGEYGQTGEPEAFAAKLREVLAGVG
jgi:pimeloyl-ACP methyl ester carboxylesterase